MGVGEDKLGKGDQMRWRWVQVVPARCPKAKSHDHEVILAVSAATANRDD